MMRFTEKESKTLSEAIASWERDGAIDAPTASRLRESYAVQKTDWKRVARYSFLIAAVCAVIGFSAAMMDDLLAERIDENPGTVALIFALLSGMTFVFGHRRGKMHPEQTFGNETVLLFGTLLAAAGFAALDKAVTDNGWMERTSLLILAAAVLYGVIGIRFRSTLVWTFAVLSFGSWFGMETGYVSGRGAYYLGMNYPLRFAVFGAALMFFSILKIPVRFQRSNFILGMLYLFVSLWILSIFGNVDFWKTVSREGALFWSVIFGVAAVAAIAHGLRFGDAATRGFGATFLLLNLYTKYFEYFWDEMHKAAFFLLLAVSFWLIGRKSESLRNLDFLRKK